MFLILAFVISLPAVTVRFYASDEIEYFAHLRSMWFDGDLSFDNEYRYFYDRNIARGWRFKETFLDGPNRNGSADQFCAGGFGNSVGAFLHPYGHRRKNRPRGGCRCRG